MEKRRAWISALDHAWERHRIVWLSGVRRTGKTTLCQSLPGIRYFDCELPSVRRLVEDPEDFLKSQGSVTLALDEIHLLRDPSNLLKIAADHLPKATNKGPEAVADFSRNHTERLRDALAPILPVIALANGLDASRHSPDEIAARVSGTLDEQLAIVIQLVTVAEEKKNPSP